MTASLLGFPGLFSVFWYSGRSQQCCSLDYLDSSSILSHSSTLSSSLLGPFQLHQSQMVSPSPSFSSAFSVLWQGPRICLSFRFLSYFTLWSAETSKDNILLFIYLLLINTRLGHSSGDWVIHLYPIFRTDSG